MESNILNSLENFILGKDISKQEIKRLKQFFDEKTNEAKISNWLDNNWLHASIEDIEISFETLKTQIYQHDVPRVERTKTIQKLSRLTQYYQKAAAVLLIPLIIGLSIFLLDKINVSNNFYVAEAPAGQKAKIELPDGSKVWLNSDSKIKYSSDFNEKNRTIELNGEAFFDVEKNKGKPFIVKTSSLNIEVTGTRFNVNAYADEPIIETSLVEGSVNIHLKENDNPLLLEAGNVISYSKKTGYTEKYTLHKEAKTAWTENRLVFINDNFEKLARKIEKWYNVEVIYNEDLFANNKLTVKLFEGEQISKLLEIIETALSANCEIEKNKIYITKK